MFIGSGFGKALVLFCISTLAACAHRRGAGILRWGVRVLTLLLAAASLAGAATSKAPLTHETLWRMKQVGAPAPSPDGRWVVVPVTEPAYDEKDEIADLWLLSGNGDETARQLTTAKGKETSPAWSPDGNQVAFSAKRETDKAAQIHIIALAGGEARRLTDLALGARQPQWSPDGRWILFQASVHRDANSNADNKRIDDERKEAKAKVRIYESFPIRRWDKWLDDVQTHLFVIPADGRLAPRDLLAGTAMVRSPGFRGPSEEGSSDSLQPEWAPNSRSIIFVATTNGEAAAFSQPRQDLYEVSLDGGEPRRLTTGRERYASPVFTPNGKRLCFTANAEQGETYYALDRLMSAPWPWDGTTQAIAPDFDRSVLNMAVSPDSTTLVVTAEESGRVRLWSVPLEGGRPTPTLDSPAGVWQSIRIPPRASSPVVYANWEAAHQPAELFRVDLATATRRRLSTFVVDQAEAIDWAPLREFWFTNRTGRIVHSYLALPAAFEPSQKYPLLVLIHGGHASMWRDSITRRWNYHLLAQPGYVVLLTDYVGSTGYGEAFTRAIRGDPLRGPAEDINAAADEAIRRYSFIDGTRQAAAGASYGGHLANWLEATTTRYRCLISHAGLASLYSQWATSDGIYHRELMMNGPFWERASDWLEQSPAIYAKDFRTPMLLSVGESDYRVPLNNVVEMWSLLQRQRVPGRLLIWPDENHWITKGENSRVFYAEAHAWLAKWLRP
jgi:dipeptidyl aminopeptidase/acylaminoacyl peptidase